MQVIHCDRIRKAKQQILAWEGITGNESSDSEKQNSGENDRIWLGEDIPIINDNEEYEIDFGRGKRNRHRPNWMKDYILSIFRTDMGKTKTTPRKKPHKCSSCSSMFSTKSAAKYHMLTEHLGENG